MFGLKEFANRFEHFLVKWKLTAVHDRRRINMYEYITCGNDSCLYICEKHSITRSGVLQIVVKIRKDGDQYAILNYTTVCKCPLINAHLYPRRGEIANEDKNTCIINSSRRERTKDGLTYLRNVKRKIRGKVISFLMDTDWKFNVTN